MLNFARWKVILCAAAVLFGVLFTAPNLLPANVLASLPAWAPHQ
jgi:preprotein translocase subunit SecD